MLALGLTPTALSVLTKLGVAPTPAPAPISTVAADGWQATMVTPAELALSPVGVSRQGFSAAGAATTIAETLLTTKRVRQAYPNHALLSTASVALSDYVYSTDTIVGVTNGSAETSPKPVCNWIMPHRLVVGNALEAEVVAFHRNASGGQQVACVVFSASDGVSTVTATVAAAAVSGRTGDRNAVLSYKASLDITGLNAGLITLNAKVHPRIGAAHATPALSSIADSALDGNAAREFSPRYFLKNTALAANPPYAYVAKAADAPNGIGTPTSSGVVSTTLATAKATPFDTVTNAVLGIHNAYTATTGVDGCIVMLGDDAGTPHVLASNAATRTQKVGALTITRDPNVAKANARCSMGAATYRMRLGASGGFTGAVTTGALRFLDVAFVRTGAVGTFQGEATSQTELIFDQVDWDNGATNAAYLNQSHDYHYGTTFTNLTLNSSLGAGTYEHRIFRGISLQPASVAGGISVEGWLVIGSAIKNPQFTQGARSFTGGIHAFNTYTDPPSTATMLGIASAEAVTGFAFAQNLVEYISATTNLVLGVSADATTGSNSHIVIHQNTCAGAFQAGRWNVFYDDGATRRTSKLQSVVGNIAVAVFTKSDVFSTAGANTGNWAFSHGVGCRDNFSQFQSADAVGQGASQAQDYAGIGANYGTSQTARNDPLFTTYAGTTVAAGPTYTGGTGGGGYTLQEGSPARAMVDDPVLNFGVSGAARAAVSDAAGAYA